MKIIVDTRERRPLVFNHPYITKIINKKLDVGDYAAEFEDGHIPSIVFDRKSISDLYGTMGHGYNRFKKCIIKANNSNKTLFVIVEGGLNKILNGYSRCSISGESMIKKLFTLHIRHGVQTIYCRDRNEMATYITNFYLACGREYMNNRKAS